MTKISLPQSHFIFIFSYSLLHGTYIGLWFRSGDKIWMECLVLIWDILYDLIVAADLNIVMTFLLLDAKSSLLVPLIHSHSLYR